MSPENIIHLDFDQTADILYVARDGVNLDGLVNIDSQKIAGVVKRIDPETMECVGFIIHGFSRLYPEYAKLSTQQIQSIMDLSLKLSSDCVHAGPAF